MNSDKTNTSPTKKSGKVTNCLIVLGVIILSVSAFYCMFRTSRLSKPFEPFARTVSFQYPLYEFKTTGWNKFKIEVIKNNAVVPVDDAFSTEEISIVVGSKNTTDVLVEGTADFIGSVFTKMTIVVPTQEDVEVWKEFIAQNIPQPRRLLPSDRLTKTSPDLKKMVSN